MRIPLLIGFLGVFVFPCEASGIFKEEVRDLDLPCLVKDTDYYLGFGLGKSQPRALNHSATAQYFGASNLFIGKRISTQISIEADYNSLGSFFNRSTAETTILNAYSAVLVGKYAFDDERYFTAFGRVGYSYTSINLIPVGTAWHGDVTYGLGLEVTLSPAVQRVWYVRMAADNFNVGSLTPITPNGFAPKDLVTNYSASLLFNF